MADLTRRDCGADDRRDAVPLRHVVGAGGIHDDRDAGLAADLRDGRPLVTAERADEEVHLLLQREAARLRQRLVGIALRVGDDDVDLAVADFVPGLLPEKLEAVDHVGRRRRQRASHRREEADADRLLRVRSARSEGGNRHREDQ
jgi:hypothetical protein